MEFLLQAFNRFSKFEILQAKQFFTCTNCDIERESYSNFMRTMTTSLIPSFIKPVYVDFKCVSVLRIQPVNCCGNKVGQIIPFTWKYSLYEMLIFVVYQ